MPLPAKIRQFSNAEVSYVIHECVRKVVKRHGPGVKFRSITSLRTDDDDHSILKRRMIDELSGGLESDGKKGWFDSWGRGSTLLDPSTDADMSMAASLVSLNSIYTFRLVPNSATMQFLSSTAGGVLSGFQTVDPSGGGTWTASEWATLVTLFSEVQFQSFEMIFWPVNLASTMMATATLGSSIAISGVLSTVTAAPTAVNQVLDNADSRIYSFINDHDTKLTKHRIVGTDISWAIVTTPNPGSYAGCPGSIQYYGNGLPVTVALLFYTMVGIYKFRSRI